MHSTSIQRSITAAALLVLYIASFSGHTAEWSGNLTVEGRWYAKSAQNSQQKNSNASVSFEPEFYHQITDSRDNIRFTSFFRLDQNDDDRSHADIRELYWQKVARDWELSLGFKKVYWGVTETAHLVDIINQTDAIENIDGENKLGQPMVQLTLIRNWGNFDLFLLPYFRERTFPSNEGRPQFTPLVIDTDKPLYEDNDEEQHIDYAMRWSKYIGILDIGLSYFNGTNRDPSLILNTSNPANPVLQPFYNQIDQIGIDFQATLESWLLKLEVIRRNSNNLNYTAAAGGFEYTFVGVFDSATDIGIVGEYLYDKRKNQPFQDDFVLGARITLNDVQSTEMLIAAINDRDDDTYSYFIEASRRLGNSYKLNVELRGAGDTNVNHPLYMLEQDRFLQVELAYYF